MNNVQTGSSEAMTQTGMLLANTDPASKECPVSFNGALEAEPAAPGQRLVRVSEVARDYPQSSPLASVLDWMRAFLARAHPELGRKGAVCPFVPLSLEQDSIWMSEIADSNATVDSISAVIRQYRDRFLVTEPVSGPDTINKAFVVVFPNLGPDGAGVVDEVQSRLKKDFVDMGLMLGEFHAANQSPGLRNAEFRPLRSPIPMLAMRHMVDSDLPFLLRYVYAPEARASFLRSYLFRLAGTLGQARFDQALDGVIEAEIEKWIASAAEVRAR
jgi:hypothetical protein